MDLSTALPLIAAVFVVMELIKGIFPKISSQQKIIAAVVVGQAVTFLFAHSDFGNQAIISKIQVDSMGFAALILVGLAVAGVAAFGQQVVQNAIPSIGENKAEDKIAA